MMMPLVRRGFARCANALVIAMAGLATCGAVRAQGLDPSCGSLQASFGPFDYRTERGHHLYVVESVHLAPVVESLFSGTTGPLGADFDFTLRAFPNHHRALVSQMRCWRKTNLPQLPNMRSTVDCYFDRDLQIRSDDTLARMSYATHLYQSGRSADAAAQLERTSFDAKENGFIHYNIGLVHLEAKQHDEALVQSHRAC